MRTTNLNMSSGQSMAATFSTEPIILDEFDGISFHASFTGSPVGTFTVEVTNFKNESPVWTTLADMTLAISGAGEATWERDGIFFRAVRITYTASSGSGSCDIQFNGKGE